MLVSYLIGESGGKVVTLMYHLETVACTLLAVVYTCHMPFVLVIAPWHAGGQ